MIMPFMTGLLSEKLQHIDGTFQYEHLLQFFISQMGKLRPRVAARNNFLRKWCLVYGLLREKERVEESQVRVKPMDPGH